MIFTFKKYTLAVVFLSLIGSANLCAMGYTENKAENVEGVNEPSSPRINPNGHNFIFVDSSRLPAGMFPGFQQQAPAVPQGPFAQRLARRAGDLALTGVEDGFRIGIYRFTTDLTRDVLSIALGTVVRSGSNVVRYVAGINEKKDPADEKLVELKKAVLKLRRAKEGLAVNKILLQELEESDQLLGSEDEESSEELQKQKEDFVRQQKILAQEEQVLRAQIQEAKKKFESQAGA